MAEDVDTFPRKTTAAGRALIDGGGIFPDLEIQGDTLRTVEQDFIRLANEQQFPLGARIAELGVSVAAGRDPGAGWRAVTDEELEAFVAQLRNEGLETDFLSDPVVVDYLRWRADAAVAQRMADIGAEAMIRTRRDPVLSEAIRLIETAASQSELFADVDTRPGAPQAPRADRSAGRR